MSKSFYSDASGVIRPRLTRSASVLKFALAVMTLLVAGCPFTGGGGTAPTMRIQQGSTPIESGTGRYSFLEGVVIDGDGGNVSIPVSFTIQNRGDKDLTISGVTLSSGDIGDFDLNASGMSGVVAGGAATSFTASFDPQVSMGVRTAKVTVTSNDETSGTYTFDLKGLGMKKVTSSDGGGYFGTPVAISGDTLVVGAPGIDAAYVLYRNQGGTDNWGEVRKLTGPDRFGCAVSIAGDTVVVGACYADDSAFSNDNRGAAFVFYRNQGGTDNWGQVKQLIANDWAWDDDFGDAVAVAGDTVIVGVRHKSSGTAYGTAYVYYRNQGGMDGWGQVKKITAIDGAQNAYFGTSIALYGDTAVIGAPGATIGSNYSQGAAYVYYRNQGGTDSWGPVGKLTANNGAQDDHFGQSASLDVDVLVVGANMDNLGTGWQGSASVYYRNEGGLDSWGQVKNLVAGDGVGGDNFACSVVVSGGDIVVGANNDTPDVGSSLGSQYLFSNSEGGVNNWGQAFKLSAGDSAPGGGFGSSVAIAGSTVVVGSGGAVYIYQK
jgi:hypothetical protein